LASPAPPSGPPPASAPKARSTVFVSYNGLLDPLGPSQILLYLERLHPTWPVHILSFERRARLAKPGVLAVMEARLRSQGIAWTWRHYHKFPSLPATSWDLLQGVRALRRILREEDVGLVHARGYVPATITLRATRRHPFLFDIRGLQAEEYVDGGVWREGGLKHRLAKRLENEMFARAAGAVVLTKAIAPYAWGRFAEHGRQPPLEIIPCCVDLDSFAFDPGARRDVREALRVAPDAALFVYSGSLGTWYLPGDMARFVKAFREATGRAAHLLWVVNNAPEVARQASRDAGLAEGEVTVLGAAAADVPRYLSAADAAVALIRPCFSKRSSSPTKYAEALAVGLPLLISRDVGDGAALEARKAAVALAYPLAPGAMPDAARRLARLMEKPRAHFRAIARDMFDVDTVALPAYRRLYERLCLP
jgi:glycosyltransferase involved in cell wall biosynthesis